MKAYHSILLAEIFCHFGPGHNSCREKNFILLFTFIPWWFQLEYPVPLAMVFLLLSSDPFFFILQSFFISLMELFTDLMELESWEFSTDLIAPLASCTRLTIPFSTFFSELLASAPPNNIVFQYKNLLKSKLFNINQELIYLQ